MIVCLVWFRKAVVPEPETTVLPPEITLAAMRPVVAATEIRCKLDVEEKASAMATDG